MPGQRPAELINARLASAMTHPTRIRTMRVLTEREATPREIADEIGEELNNVAYHVKILKELGCIELVHITQAHGGRVAEHLYRGAQRPYFQLEDLERLSDSEKLNLTSAVMQHIADDVAAAMAHGTFYTHDDNHMSRMPMILDGEGWNETSELLDTTLDALMAIQERVNARKGDETMPAKVAILQFESPPLKKPRNSP